MRGMMMDATLWITGIMRFADRNFPEAEVVSITADSERHRYSYGELFRRTRQLANALQRLDLRPGDRVGTLAWNDHRRLEIYYYRGNDDDTRTCDGWFDGKVARWWIPDDVVFVDALPHTATGKLAKNELRKTYADYRLPETEDGS